MRSGTTLLQSVLCRSPDTHPLIHECNYLTSQLRLYRSWAEQADARIGDYFGSAEGLAEHTRALIAALLERFRETIRPGHTLVLKNPELSRFFPDLAMLVPDAKFVVSVRDPRDAIASMLAVSERQRRSGGDDFLANVRDDARKLCAFYKSYYAPVLAAPPALKQHLNGRVLFSKYEHLLTRPGETAQEIAAFCDISLAGFDPESDWSSRIDYAAAAPDPGPWGTLHYGRGLSTEPIGRYRERLSAAQVAEIDRHCADIYRIFGYRPADEAAADTPASP